MPLRWIIRPWFTSSLLLCRTRRRFCLATCQKSTTSTRGEGAPSACHWWYHFTCCCSPHWCLYSREKHDVAPDRQGQITLKCWPLLNTNTWRFSLHNPLDYKKCNQIWILLKILHFIMKMYTATEIWVPQILLRHKLTACIIQRGVGCFCGEIRSRGLCR